MLVQTAASKPELLQEWRSGVWRFHWPHSAGMMAGVTDRSATLETLRAHVRAPGGVVEAEQVHGASVAVVDAAQPPINPVPGCDGLLTRLPGIALVVRSADCLPIMVWDGVQRMVGVAHVGWRGLERQLPARLIGAARHYAHSRVEHLWVGIGPAIRACCYEVGPEFVPRFGRFVQDRDGRLTCDLAGCAIEQLRAAGIPPSHIADCGQCTACEDRRWYSLRREAGAAGRLLSFVVLRAPPTR